MNPHRWKQLHDSTLNDKGGIIARPARIHYKSIKGKQHFTDHTGHTNNSAWNHKHVMTMQPSNSWWGARLGWSGGRWALTDEYWAGIKGDRFDDG